MLAFVLTLIAVFGVLCLSELGWRHGSMSNEMGRKFVHVTVGSFVAFWPFFLSWNQIRLLSLGFLIVVIASKYLHVFKAIHSVQRPTYGEIMFALVVGGLTFVTKSKGIYAAALLQMSLADGMAAVIGVQYGLKKPHKRYKVFGHTKTVFGTVTFFAVSFALLMGYGADTLRLGLGWTLGSVAAAAVATGIENVAVAGLDNLLVPLFIALLLTWW